MTKPRQEIAVRVEPELVSPEVAAAIIANISVTSLGKIRREDPTFPKARTITGSVIGFDLNELRAWAKARPVAENLPPPSAKRNAV